MLGIDFVGIAVSYCQREPAMNDKEFDPYALKPSAQYRAPLSPQSLAPVKRNFAATQSSCYYKGRIYALPEDSLVKFVQPKKKKPISLKIISAIFCIIYTSFACGAFAYIVYSFLIEPA